MRVVFRLLSMCLLFAFFSMGAQAQNGDMTTTTVVEKHIVVSPPPASVSCTTVAGHFEGDIWVDKQTVCTYANRSEGAAWVQDYWACNAFTATGDCTSWAYMPGHWVKTLSP